jgi:hypothetical protein
MTTADTWPDAATYVPLTAPPVAAAIQGHNEDNETDLYIPPTPEIPFTIPHIFSPLSVTGPLITGFPINVRALMDVGCPCTVISLKLCEILGLRRYKLPKREDNLSSLTKLPLTCTEYVKLEVQSGQGQWKSGVIRMKVNKGLCFPIILGMPFLSSERIVIDAHK